MLTVLLRFYHYVSGGILSLITFKTAVDIIKCEKADKFSYTLL